MFFLILSQKTKKEKPYEGFFVKNKEK